MRSGVFRISTLVALPFLFACSERRPLNFIDEETPDAVHEPFENQEAEELALELSSEFVAPENLYRRVERDLASIREQLGDSLPIVNQYKYRFRYRPGEVVIFLHDEINAGDWLARTSGFAQIREQFAFDSMRVIDNRIVLNSRYRMNTTYLLRRFERLPGVCWAQPTSQGRVPFGAVVTGDTIDYAYVNVGICIVYCQPTHYFWFTSTTAGMDYIGHFARNANDTIPDDFKSVWRRSKTTSTSDKLDSIKFRDETPQARATDLRLIGDQINRQATVSFTAPGDDGNEGMAYSATLCLADKPITFENFNTVGYHSIKINPGYSGDEHLIALNNLLGNKTNYVAVRFIDCNQNLSQVSNVLTTRNIWLNGWTYLDSDNSPLPDNRITRLLRDSRNRIWIATQNGLACKDGESWSVFRASTSGIPSDFVTSIAEGPDGAIWIGTVGGLGKLDDDGWQAFTTSNSGIPKQEIECVAVAQDGSVWIGYAQFGLVRFHEGTWTTYDRYNSPLRGSSVFAILTDSRGDVWVGTNAGVTRIRYDNWESFDPTNSGLAAYYAVNLHEDTRGRVWCGSLTNGVSWYDDGTWNSHEIAGLHVTSITHTPSGDLF